jgi:integrase
MLLMMMDCGEIDKTMLESPPPPEKITPEYPVDTAPSINLVQDIFDGVSARFTGQTMENPKEVILITKDELAVIINSAIENTIREIKKSQESQSTRGSGFCLDKRPNKKNGFLYYVRYRYKGKTLPSKWNTHTNDFLQAKNFAVNNRDRIIEEYFTRKSKQDLYDILTDYYKIDSPYLAVDKNRKRTFCDQRRRIYYNFINKKFIPFLKRLKIKQFNQIKPSHLAALQDELLENGNKPQTINDHLSGVKMLFDHLLRKNIMEHNPFKELTPLMVKAEDVEIAGCYDTYKIKGVFNKSWQDEIYYFLCLIAYTTGMREIEIMNMRVSDIISIGGYKFIDIKKSKTINGIRIIPLHNFVYAKVMVYIKVNGIKNDGLIFEYIKRDRFIKANIELACMLSGERKPDKVKIKAELQMQNITFKSGRHFWKTMMNAKDLGENIEEVFMGHKVTKDVAKIYNHRDKQGKEKLLQKTECLMRILDEVIF